MGEILIDNKKLLKFYEIRSSFQPAQPAAKKLLALVLKTSKKSKKRRQKRHGKFGAEKESKKREVMRGGRCKMKDWLRTACLSGNKTQKLIPLVMSCGVFRHVFVEFRAKKN